LLTLTIPELLQPSKILLPFQVGMCVHDDKSNIENFEQFLNTLSLICPTFLGIIKLPTILEHPKNAELEITSNLFERVRIPLKPEQSLNALEPIDITLLGIVKLPIKLLQALKALEPIVLIVFGNNKEVILVLLSKLLLPI
jgi:hypothetical protein